jgi:hypothetical protein
MTTLRHRLVSPLIALAIAAAAGDALAQSAGAPAAVPKHKCENPGDHPGKLASDNQRRSWTRNMNAYFDCLKKFIAEQQVAAEPYLKAGNAAIEEYNTNTNKFNTQIEETRQ